MISRKLLNARALPACTHQLRRNVLTAVQSQTCRQSQDAPPLTQFSEEELAFKNSGLINDKAKMIEFFSVKLFSNDVIKPLVREMDAKSAMDKRVIDGVFENGVSKFKFSD